MPIPAQSLSEARSRLSLEPLSDTASDYVDLSKARGTECLKSLAFRLRQHAASSDARREISKYRARLPLRVRVSPDTMTMISFLQENQGGISGLLDFRSTEVPRSTKKYLEVPKSPKKYK